MRAQLLLLLGSVIGGLLGPLTVVAQQQEEDPFSSILDEASITEPSFQELRTFASRIVSEGASAASVQRPFDPVLDLDPVDLIAYWGYPAERHWVTTDDGYVLGVHRIPAGPEGPASSASPGGSRPAVILGHGLLCSSADWILQGPGKSLAFQLADAGYDVWILNLRGNTYSKNHTTLSPSDREFWDYTYHEHGLYDLPNTIEYVVDRTGQDQVHYVGHSMGNAVMLIAAQFRPDVARHVKLFTALAPYTDFRPMRSVTFRAFLAAVVVANAPELLTGTSVIGSREVLASTPALRRGGEILCKDGALTQPLCAAVLYSLSGKNEKRENMTLYPTLISRTPAGTSLKNLFHFGQSFLAGFKQYNYGPVANLRRYGTLTAPAYDMSKTQMPVRVHYGLNDLTVDTTSVQHLCSVLPNVLSCDAVPDAEWTHLNVIYAKGVDDVLNDKVIADLNSFEGRS